MAGWTSPCLAPSTAKQATRATPWLDSANQASPCSDRPPCDSQKVRVLWLDLLLCPGRFQGDGRERLSFGDEIGGPIRGGQKRPRVHRHIATSAVRGACRTSVRMAPGSEIDRRFQAVAGAPMLGEPGLAVCFFSSWGVAFPWTGLLSNRARRQTGYTRYIVSCTIARAGQPARTRCHMEMTLGSPHACIDCTGWSLWCASAANSCEGQGAKRALCFLRCDEEAARGHSSLSSVTTQWPVRVAISSRFDSRAVL